LIHPRRARSQCPAPLSLTRTPVRERFSPLATRFHTIVPIILSAALLVTSARSLAVLGPAFRASVSRSPAAPRLPSVSLHLEEHPLPGGDLSPVFTPEVQRWAKSIRRWSDEYALPANLIAVVMQIESCGDPLAVSPSGAMGLFQVMPYHFTPDDDPFDVETNAARGLSYLSAGLGLASDDMTLALAGYNGGNGIIELPDEQWAGETQRYVSWGVGILEDAAAGLNSSPNLEAWLASGGVSLCRQAAQHVATLQSASG
jgi:hypothetical protein